MHGHEGSKEYGYRHRQHIFALHYCAPYFLKNGLSAYASIYRPTDLHIWGVNNISLSYVVFVLSP